MIAIFGSGSPLRFFPGKIFSLSVSPFFSHGAIRSKFRLGLGLNRESEVVLPRQHYREMSQRPTRRGGGGSGGGDGSRGDGGPLWWGRTCRPFCHCDIIHPSQFEPSSRVLHRYSARVRDQRGVPSTLRAGVTWRLPGVV